MTFAVSINPVYKCNLRCDFCYLTTSQLSDSTLLNLDDLDAKLLEISQYKQITQVDVYGGEITLLDEQYIIDMFNIIGKYYSGDISVITNLTQVPDWLNELNVDVSVSWDYIARPSSFEKVLENMVSLTRPFHILTLVSKSMIEWDDETLQHNINICDMLNNVKTVELKPYSSNQSNQDDISFKDYERFVQRWIELSPAESRQYEFVTENKIIEVLAGQGHAWSDDHIYITPNGSLAVLDFDKHDNEQFIELYDWFDYLKWVMEEYVTVTTNKFCGYCEFRGGCLSEHLRTVLDYDANSCSGFKGLLEWYRTTK